MLKWVEDRWELVEVPAPAPPPSSPYPGACCRRRPLAAGARAPLVERCNVPCEQGVRWQVFVEFGGLRTYFCLRLRSAFS